MDRFDLRSDVREVVSEELERFGLDVTMTVTNTVADYTHKRFWIQIVAVLALTALFFVSFAGLQDDSAHLVFTLVSFQLLVYAVRSVRRINTAEKFREIIRRGFL